MTPSTPARRLVRELPPCEQPVQRLRQQGAGALSLAELLATLLSSPDALDLAQELLAHFGVAGLLHASLAELQAVPGIGLARAAQVRAALELGRRLLSHSEERPQFSSPGTAAAYLMPLLGQREQEHFLVLLLNTKNHLTDTIWLYQGTLDSSVIRIGEVFREAIRRNAAAILVAHNHPSSVVEPSAQDRQVTHEIYLAGELLGISLVDHLVVSHQGYWSFREHNALSKNPATSHATLE